jgi:hypothetical protein
LPNTILLGNSLLSEGKFHHSKWSADYELQLSKNGRFAESGKSEQTWPSGTNQDFGEISP